MSLPWVVEFYEEEDGSVPVREYFSTLLPGEQKRFQTRLTQLSQEGLNASVELARKLDSVLWELRLANSPNNPRVLFCARVGRRVVLLHGFSKTGRANDKVPEAEKTVARKRLSALEAREYEQEDQPKENERAALEAHRAAGWRRDGSRGPKRRKSGEKK